MKVKTVAQLDKRAIRACSALVKAREAWIKVAFAITGSDGAERDNLCIDEIATALQLRVAQDNCDDAVRELHKAVQLAVKTKRAAKGEK